MRIWSLHPKYLDAKGLVALWRETLLAKKVLTGKTKGYKNHPQLIRFKLSERPLELINQYLFEVFNEATLRGYNFNKEKIDIDFKPGKLTVTKGQLEYEKKHLLNKLIKRDHERYLQNSFIEKWEAHPLFTIVNGNIEKWEIITANSISTNN